MGFDPLSWDKFKNIKDKSDVEAKLAETAQIAESAIESIKSSLNRLIQQKKIYGKIESKQNGSGYYFIKEKDKEEIQKVLKEDLLEIKVFLKEFYPKVVFHLSPSINKKIDEIMIEAQRYNIQSIIREAKDLKKEFFKEE